MTMDRDRITALAAKIRLKMPHTNGPEFRSWRRTVEAVRDTAVPGYLTELFDELSGYGEWARVERLRRQTA
jgi:hypothetical protein